MQLASRRARTGFAGTSRAASPRSSPRSRRRRSRSTGGPGGRRARAAPDRSDRAARRDRGPRRISCRPRSPGTRCSRLPALLLARLELGEAHALERRDRVVDRVVAQRLQRLLLRRGVRDGARGCHVVRRRVGRLVEPVEVDLARGSSGSGRRSFSPLELREVDAVEPGGAVELGAARLVLLRLRVQLQGVLAQLLLDLRGGSSDDVDRPASSPTPSRRCSR